MQKEISRNHRSELSFGTIPSDVNGDVIAAF
jgi:hypothetical protein